MLSECYFIKIFPYNFYTLRLASIDIIAALDCNLKNLCKNIILGVNSNPFFFSVYNDMVCVMINKLGFSLENFRELLSFEDCLPSTINFFENKIHQYKYEKIKEQLIYKKRNLGKYSRYQEVYDEEEEEYNEEGNECVH